MQEKDQLVASHTPPTRDLACNPAMCPDLESNWLPFGSQAGTQSTDPDHPGLYLTFKWAGWRWTKGEKFETAIIAINNKTQKTPTNYAIKNTDRNLT